MLNEGMTAMDTAAAMRNEMLEQLERMGEATADAWERAVFESLTGHTREDVDWEFEDNQAGYYTWLKAFDRLVQELVADRFVESEPAADAPRFRLRETDPAIGWSRRVYPPRN